MAKKEVNILLGSHVSNSGDEMLVGSVKEALSYKANCFMVYLGPPQNTLRKDVNRLNISEMKEMLINNDINIENVIVHAPYILNLATVIEEKRRFAIEFLTKEMKTMAKAGFKYMVVHPGAHMKHGEEIGLKMIAYALIEILDNTKYDDTVILLETMAGKGTECGKTFEEIKTIIDYVNSSRVKVCFDTCHVHDSGYNLVKEYDEVFNKFDEIIGLENIKAIHLNDSKNELGSKKDRHENIGFGKIGFKTLLKVAFDERFKDVPKILETPYVNDLAPYYHEIEMIKSKKFNKELKEQIVK